MGVVTSKASLFHIRLCLLRISYSFSQIVSLVNRSSCHVMLFSATFPPEVRQYAVQVASPDPFKITVKTKALVSVATTTTTTLSSVAHLRLRRSRCRTSSTSRSRVPPTPTSS